MKKRDSKDEQNFNILRRLAELDTTGIELARKNFEKLREEGTDYKSIPHSTVIDRLNELLEAESIKEYKSGKKSKKGLPIMEYSITSIGLIHLLRLCYGRPYQKKVFNNLMRLPYLDFHINKLLAVFTKEQLFDTLVSVCYNTIIEIDKESIDSQVQKKFHHVRMHTMAELLKGKKGLKIYYITIKFPDVEPPQFVWKRIPSFANIISEKKVFDAKVVIVISKMISCAFFHELFLRCSDLRYSLLNYPAEGRAQVMKVISTDPELKEMYYEFLSQMVARLHDERKQIEKIRSFLE